MLHETDRGQIAHSGQGFGQTFVVTGLTAKAGDSTDAAFNHSAARKQHKTPLGLNEFDYFECSAVRKVRTGVVLAGVTLIDVG